MLLLLLALMQTPPGRVPVVSGSAGAFELGARFTVDVPGQLMALRLWRLPGDPGPHVGHVWNAAGVLLATVTFTNETPMGWQEQALPMPLTLVPGPYIFSANSVLGMHFPLIVNGLATATNNGHVAVTGGAFATATGTFPATASPNDYFRDVVFFAAATQTVAIGLPLNGKTASGTVTVASLVTGLVPGDYTLTLTLSDALGKTTTSAAHMQVDDYPFQAGDSSRSWVYTFVTATGETLPSQPALVTPPPTGGPFFAQVSAILPGPTGTVARNLYRTAKGSTQLKLVSRINDNLTTVFDDHVLDSALGPNAPLTASAAIAQPLNAPIIQGPPQ